MIGRSPDAVFSDLCTTDSDVLTGLVAYSDPVNSNDWNVYYTTATHLKYVSNTESKSVLLSDINATVENVSLKSSISVACRYILLSINNNIYIIDPSLKTTSLISDYNGVSYDIVQHNSRLYIAYTYANSFRIVLYNRISVKIYAEFRIVRAFAHLHLVRPYCNLRLIVCNNKPYLFMSDLKHNIYSTVISNNNIRVNNNITYSTSYKLICINNTIYIIGINHNNIKHTTLNRDTIYINRQNPLSYSSIDSCSINNEEYVFYIDSTGILRQAWNPVNMLQININQTITSIAGSVSSNQLTPAFSNTINDYGILTGSINDPVTFSFTINGVSVSDTAYPNQLIMISDGVHKYYVRILPDGFLYGNVMTKTPDYVPGYYLTSSTQGEKSYYSIYDSNGVPVWWRRTTSDPNFVNNPQVAAIQRGGGKNRVITLIFDGFRPRTIVDVATLEEENYVPIVGSRENTYFWEVHESIELRAPASRRGNIMYQSYTNGIYIQEQTPNHKFVWDWFSTDYNTQTNSEFYHVNSLDVHPVTGDIVVSARNINCVFCINYATKNIDWAIDPYDSLRPGMINASATKFLSISGEPIINGTQYNGTSAQHDARWHPEIAPLTAGNQVISIFDDQSFHGRPSARGVIYEIDFDKGKCIFRGNCYSPRGTSGYMGSYRINFEANGTSSHTCDFVQQHPSIVEFSGDSAGMPTQNIVFEMDLPGDRYRQDKATVSDLTISDMRLTCGMPYSTV